MALALSLMESQGKKSNLKHALEHFRLNERDGTRGHPNSSGKSTAGVRSRFQEQESRSFYFMVLGRGLVTSTLVLARSHRKQLGSLLECKGVHPRTLRSAALALERCLGHNWTDYQDR